jgi:hypothetical protein
MASVMEAVIENFMVDWCQVCSEVVGSEEEAGEI